MAKEVVIDRDECTSCGQCADDLPDVFAMDDECILVVECKSSKSRKRVNYQKDINEFIGLRTKLIKIIRKDYPKNYSLNRRSSRSTTSFATNSSTATPNSVLPDSRFLTAKVPASNSLSPIVKI